MRPNHTSQKQRNNASQHELRYTSFPRCRMWNHVSLSAYNRSKKNQNVVLQSSRYQFELTVPSCVFCVHQRSMNILKLIFSYHTDLNPNHSKLQWMWLTCCLSHSGAATHYESFENATCPNTPFQWKQIRPTSVYSHCHRARDAHTSVSSKLHWQVTGSIFFFFYFNYNFLPARSSK